MNDINFVMSSLVGSCGYDLLNSENYKKHPVYIGFFLLRL